MWHVYTQKVELVWGEVCNLYTPLSREEGTSLHNKGNSIQMWKYPTRTLPSLNTSAPLQGVGLKMYYIRKLFRSGLATLIAWSTTAGTMRTRLSTIFTILLSSCSSRLSFFKFLANF